MLHCLPYNGLEFLRRTPHFVRWCVSYCCYSCCCMYSFIVIIFMNAGGCTGVFQTCTVKKPLNVQQPIFITPALAVQGRCNADPNSRSVTIMITDCCPECEADHLDIQALTFNKFAPMALGRVDIKYRRRACQASIAVPGLLACMQRWGFLSVCATLQCSACHVTCV